MTNDKRVVVTSDIEVQVHGKDSKLYLHAIQKWISIELYIKS